MPISPPYTPLPVDDAQLAIPGDVWHLVPFHGALRRLLGTYREESVWYRLVNDWIDYGLDDIRLTARMGIAQHVATRHVTAIIRSPTLDRDQKVVACCLLLDTWFMDDQVAWARRKVA